jgi:hypothetical protein
MTERKPGEPAGLSTDQETVLVAIGQAMDGMKAHGDTLSQWRLLQIERAIEALDGGEHGIALDFVKRAVADTAEIMPREREAAERLTQRLSADRLRAAIAARRRRAD